LIFKVKNITNIHPVTNPSDPSIKLVKLIIAVIIIIINDNKKIFLNDMPKNRLKLLNFRIRIDDKNCTKYLYIDRTLNKSSQRLINISGKHNSDKGNLEDNFSENKVNKSNTNKGIIKDKPPPLGIGILCKLLLLGLSKEYLVRKISKFFKIK